MATSLGRPQPPRRTWEDLSDHDLLQVRIKDLDVRLEETGLPPLVRRLHRELGARGLRLMPDCFLADEWFCPDGQTAIGVPFYLAHPRLRALEFRMVFEVEGGTGSWAMRLLRHETGHAYDHAFGLSDDPGWERVFGSKRVPYEPLRYTADPRSRRHVVNLPEHYAQAHPEEDFAETFAVWLDPASQWRVRYRGWPAMAKLLHVDRAMRALAGQPPPAVRPRLIAEARTLRSTLAAYYRRKARLYQLDDVGFTLPDLRAIFKGGPRSPEPAARFIRSHKRELVAAVATVSGVKSSQVGRLVADLARIAEVHALKLGRDPVQALVRLSAYVATLAVNRLYTLSYRRRSR